MGREQLIGPATAYIAGELRAERARQGLTFDQVAERAGVARGQLGDGSAGSGANLSAFAALPMALRRCSSRVVM